MMTSILAAASRRLEGKVALITGGANGLGRSTVELFTRHGAKVVIADVQDDLGRSVCESLAPAATYVHCDVTDEAQVQSAVDQTVAAHGKLDIMFNNAGITDSVSGIVESSTADFERVLGINVTGVYLGIKHAARVMIPRRSGSIISMASIASLIGGASTHAYTCSKHAVVGLTRNAAVELGPAGVRVNCLSPFLVVTPLVGQLVKDNVEEVVKKARENANLKGVTLSDEDVARGALFLASDDAQYVSGHNLPIDGGVTVVNASQKIY